MRAAFSRALSPGILVAAFLAAPSHALAQGGFVYGLNQVNGGPNQIHGFSVNSTSGVLTALPGFPVATGGNGSFLTVSQQLFYDRATSRLYALNDGSDTVSAFAVNRFNGALTALPFSPMPLGSGTWGCVATDPTGTVLAATSGAATANVATFLISSDAATSAPGSPVGAGTGATPFGCGFSHHGAYFYAGGFSGNSFAGFSVNLATAALTPLANSPFTTGAANPAAFATDALGRLFMAHITSSSVRAFTTAAGSPTAVAGNPFASGLTAAVHGILAPQGLYLVADRTGARVGAFSIAANGALAAVAGSPFASGGTGTNALALDHRGALLFAANGGTSRNITTFRVSSAAPALTPLVTQALNALGATGNLTGIAFAPPLAGGFVYALNQVSSGTNQVYGFAVNPATGALTSLAGFPVAAGTGGGDSFAEHLHYDPLNARLFVLNVNPSVGADTISVFNVNRGTGALTPLPFSPIALPAAANWACLATAGPDGSILIAGGTGSASAGIAASFKLSGFGVTMAPGSPVMATGTIAFSCAASQDGTFFYTGGNSGTGIAGFSVDGATGALTALTGSAFASGANNPIGYATDRAGRLFVSSFGGGVRVFTTTAGIPAAAAGNPFASGLSGGIHGVVSATGLYVVADRNTNDVGSFVIGGTGGTTTLTAAAGSPFASGGISPTAVAADDSGTLVFAANGTSRNLSSFSVSSSGVLTLLGVQAANTLGVTGNVTGIAFVPQAPGGFAYALNQVGSSPNHVHGFAVDAAGGLTPLPGLPVPVGNGGNGSFSEQLIYDRTNARLFVLNDTNGGGTVSAFAVSRSTGALTPLPFSPIALPGTGGWACLTTAGTDGSILIVAGGAGGGLAASFKVTATSATAAPGSPLTIAGATPFSCTASQNGGFFFTGGNEGNSFGGFSVNTTTGALTPLAGTPFTSGAVNPVAYATDGAGRLFVSSLGSGLRVFTTAGGIPTAVAGNPFTSGLTQGVQGVVTPTGFYMVADRGADRVGSFAIGGAGAATTLTATAGSPFASGGSFPVTVASDDTGRVLLAANALSRNLTSFIVSATGVLTSLGVQPVNTLGTTGELSGLVFAPRIASAFVPSPLTVNTIGAGTVTSNVGGIACGASCAATFDDGTIVALTAAPGAGSTFAGWTGGGCGSDPTCLVTVGAATSITATFGFPITPATIPSGTVGVAYNQALMPTGGTAPYAFSITAGAPPTGITLSAGGVLGGIPTVLSAGTVFTVHATDAVGAPGDVTYNLAVGCPAIAITPATVASIVLNNPFSQALAQTGGVGGVTFAITAGALPAGLSVSAEGLLTGTPTTTGAASFTVTATDSLGCTGSRGFTATVQGLPTAALSLATVNFGAVNNGAGTFIVQTPAQPLALTITGPGAVTWTVAADRPWITVSPASGSGVGTITVSINNAGGPLPTTGVLSGAVTVTTTGAANNPTAAVNLTILVGSSTAPSGLIDTPTDGQGDVTGSIAVTGWAVDDIGVSGVTLCRGGAAGEATVPDGRCGGLPQIFIGDAVLVSGARPDVAAAFPLGPLNHQAGWGYLLLTNFLPNQGNGTFTLFLHAQDFDGFTTPLGSRRITLTNATATAPLGAIDTPAQGGTASGTAFVNFGWALTPQPKSIPSDGSTIQPFIDSLPVGTVTYNLARPDIQALFPGYANTDGAVGFSVIDTTTLANGVHTIAWLVTDNQGAASGIGSRYFTVSNSSGGVTSSAQSPSTTGARAAAPAQMSSRRKQASGPPPAVHGSSAVLGTVASLAGVELSDARVTVAHGFRADAEFENVAIENGVRVVKMGPLGRIVIDLGSAGDGAAYRGYEIDGRHLRSLPLGAQLETSTGRFSWMPGLGFGGARHLVFVRAIAGREELINVRVVVSP